MRALLRRGRHHSPSGRRRCFHWRPFITHLFLRDRPHERALFWSKKRTAVRQIPNQNSRQHLHRSVTAKEGDTNTCTSVTSSTTGTPPKSPGSPSETPPRSSHKSPTTLHVLSLPKNVESHTPALNNPSFVPFFLFLSNLHFAHFFRQPPSFFRVLPHLPSTNNSGNVLMHGVVFSDHVTFLYGQRACPAAFPPGEIPQTFLHQESLHLKFIHQSSVFLFFVILLFFLQFSIFAS